MIYKHIKTLVHYGIENNLLENFDYDYAINKLCDLLELHTFENTDIEFSKVDEPSQLLKPLLDYAVSIKAIYPDTLIQRDIFEAKLMDVIIPRPSEVIKKFYQLMQTNSREATDYYYHLSQKSNYIKTLRTNNNIRWKSQTPYGLFDITINLSKPEKDPQDIINAKNNDESKYPKCLLCKEQVGYSNQLGRTNHRIIPVSLDQDLFYLQYSPYVYYNEHCIVLMDQHLSMNVTRKTFHRLLDFVDCFPHYFLGSNAGLPIVGGSILSHEHYQGGRNTFPIEHAKVLKSYKLNDLVIQKLYWPLSVIRLQSIHKDQLINAATILFEYWQDYSNEEEDILAYTDEPHNAITPIARKKNGYYELDMTLRNNRTSKEHPLGIFHPHQNHHHIKKENIGLIEVMGLAVLPARLEKELEEIKDVIINKGSLPKNHIHKDWVDTLKYYVHNQSIDEFIRDQVAVKFIKCLEDTGVFKQIPSSQRQFDFFIDQYITRLKRVNDID